MDWFRMYHEFASDAKVQSMSEAMQRRLMMLFCLRCSNALVTLQDDELAFALRISEDELSATKEIFMRKNFINEEWEIRQWNDRQFVSDSSAPRVKKHREKKKAEAKNPPVEDAIPPVEPPCNVTLTPQNRTDTEQIQNRIEAEQSVAADAGQTQPPEPAGETARAITAVDLSIAMRKAGMQTQPADPRLIALAAQGIDPETVTAACEEAKRTKPNQRIGAGYIFAILERWALDAAALKVAGATAPKSGGNWRSSDAASIAKGAEFSLTPRAGESIFTFRDRVQAKIDGDEPVPQVRMLAGPPPGQVDTPRSKRPEGLVLAKLVGPAPGAA